MKNWRKLFFAAALVVFLLLALAFPFGPLFPWSPLKLGYQATHYARGIVYLDKSAPSYGDYTQLEQLMSEAENFHQLRFQRRLRVIECKDWATCERGVPWLNMRPLGGVTLWGDAIYITPKLKEKSFHVDEFLRHELSHALIGQNTSMLNVPRLGRQPWFYEGIAVSFGHQHDYLSRAEVLEKIQTESVVQYLDPAQAPAQWNARLAYPLQRYFNEWLKATYSTEKYQRFLTRNIIVPDEWRATFEAAFEQSFSEAAERYEHALRTGAWLPAE